MDYLLLPKITMYSLANTKIEYRNKLYKIETNICNQEVIYSYKNKTKLFDKYGNQKFPLPIAYSVTLKRNRL